MYDIMSDTGKSYEENRSGREDSMREVLGVACSFKKSEEGRYWEGMAFYITEIVCKLILAIRIKMVCNIPEIHSQ